MRRLLLLAPLILLSGCVESVQPWEKATLAKETMKEGGFNKLTKNLKSILIIQKKTTKGGGTIGGGGCGCN